jgi:SSS family solute:Na+ symporter
MDLGFIDIAIVVFFITLFIFWPKLFGTNKSKSSADFLLMSQGLSMPLFVATLTSTWYGGILGVTQIAFNEGIYGFFTQGIFWYFSYFLFAVFFAKKIRKQSVLTLPELIGQKFGPQARKLSAIIIFFHALPITYALSVGLFLSLIFNISFSTAIIIGTFTVATYTALNGFRGVVLTDCLQFILMFLAVIILVITCFNNFGGLSFLKINLPEKYFSWHSDQHMSKPLIWFFIACSSTFIHPAFYQRCLAAKSENIAMWGIFLAMIMWLIFDLCTCLGGMYAKAILPNQESSVAYLILGTQILPWGLKGLFLAGVLSTILSTLDSFLFICGTSISYDFFKKTDNNSHKIAILGCAVLVIILGLLFSHNFEANWLLIEGVFSSAMLVPIVATMWSKRNFKDINYIYTALGSMGIFFLATIFKSPIMPFYLAHISAFFIFLITLYIKPQSYAQKAFFKQRKILRKSSVDSNYGQR